MYKFTYNAKYGSHEDCYFVCSRYSNNNVSVEIWNDEEGPITKVTVDPDFQIPEEYIAVRTHNGNEGLVEFLQSEDIIVESPVSTVFPIYDVSKGCVSIPIYRITEKGNRIFGLL